MRAELAKLFYKYMDSEHPYVVNMDEVPFEGMENTYTITSESISNIKYAIRDMIEDDVLTVGEVDWLYNALQNPQYTDETNKTLIIY